MKPVYLIITLALLVSCSKNIGEQANQASEPKSWTVPASEMTYTEGSTFTVEGLLIDAYGAESILKGLCTCDDVDVLYTDGGWDVIALAPGTAVLDAEVRFYNKGITTPSSVFKQSIDVTVLPEERVLSGIDPGSTTLTIKCGDSIFLKVDAVYADGTRKYINPILLDYEMEDDGTQHITYDAKTGEIKACQAGGPTRLTIFFSEKSITAHTAITVNIVD